MEIVPDVSSHMVNITPFASQISEISSMPSTPNTPSSCTPNISPSETLEPVPKKNEPEDEGPVTPHRKTRGFFRTCSSNSLHILLNEVVLPVHTVDYMKILPPPTTIYLKTVEGDFVQKRVFMNKKGDRYIIDENYNRVYLQDIRGLYRYNSA